MTLLVALISVASTTGPGSAQSLGEAAKAQSEKTKPKAKPREKSPPRVFTNDDLEEARKRPSAVQDLQAKDGTVGYEHADSAPAADSQPTPPPTPTFEEQQQGEIAAAEARLRDLEARAKELLWQQLQSTDTYEIMRLKTEQQDVLAQIETAKAELARLRGEGPPATATPEPTREPG
jgi:hypothetical protein